MREVPVPFIKKIKIQNYKSIANCDVELQPLTLLVGPNGSGKSNFLDAIRFVAESLRNPIDQALRERGGIEEVRRRSRGHPTHFRIDLELSLPSGRASYGFRVGSAPKRGFVIQEETCEVEKNDASGRASYAVEDGKVRAATFDVKPPASNDRLYLTVVSGYPEFRVIYDHLCGMGFYNINPDEIRDLQEPDAGVLLARDGSNLASVLTTLGERNSDIKERVEEYLRCIVPGLIGVDRKSLGPKETLEFRQKVAGDENPWRFQAQNMSDGTLRALGVLVALFQSVDRSPKNPVSVVGIEEPEVAVHPAAAGVLMDAMKEASHFTQVIATTHSPDLLDTRDLDAGSLLVVNAIEGNTILGSADEGSVATMRERLYTAGELLRQDQIHPRIPPVSEDQPLFKDIK
jgi:predicted ATPase